MTFANTPMLAAWTGPYGGVPPFDAINVPDMQPALVAAMADYRRELRAIADDSAAPTFENTILALENAGQVYVRAMAIYGTWSSAMKTPEFQELEREMSPKIAALRDELMHDPKIWKRVESVYAKKDSLAPEDARLAWLFYTQFSQEGAKACEADKHRISELNQRLSKLYTQFAQNLLADEESQCLVIERAEDLAGLPQSEVDGAASEAERRGRNGTWVIANTRSSMEPFLTYSANRRLRERGFAMWMRRGDNGDAHDNNAIAAEVLKLRAERSKLLGYPSYAAWHLADTMAKHPRATMELMQAVWTPAIEHVRRDVAAMQAIVDAEKGGFAIQPWDYRYYAEKVRKAKYDLDLTQVKPYMQLDRLREAMFWVAGQLYGFTFAQVNDAPVYESTMTVYEVVDRNNKHIGLWYFDPYARSGKSSGAWMSSYRDQKRGVTALVSNNCNYIRGKAGEPVLLSWDDARTLFHEFGHALHGLCSRVTYASLSGTNTARDFVELPSQFMENYLTTPEVQKMLVNAEGKPLAADLVDKIKRAATFNEGFRTVEFLSSAIADMKMHLGDGLGFDAKAFETQTLAELGMPHEIVMRHRIPQFAHVFSGEGYAAGYYGYLWAEVLDHDAYAAFVEAGSPYDPATATRFLETLMAVGNTVDPTIAYRNFRGRDASVDALLEVRGL